MKFKLETKELSRDEFFTLKEENLMFITNPGRMGDEDGSTFIIKEDNNYVSYRIDGWMYGDRTKEDFITLDEMFEQFPKWKEAWHNCNNEEYDGKYIYVYMGFGNGLSVDKSIYREYEPYLLDEVKKIKNKRNEKEESPSMYYPAWKPAVENMLNNK